MSFNSVDPHDYFGIQIIYENGLNVKIHKSLSIEKNIMRWRAQLMAVFKEIVPILIRYWNTCNLPSKITRSCITN